MSDKNLDATIMENVIEGTVTDDSLDRLRTRKRIYERIEEKLQEPINSTVVDKELMNQGNRNFGNVSSVTKNNEDTGSKEEKVIFNEDLNKTFYDDGSMETKTQHGIQCRFGKDLVDDDGEYRDASSDDFQDSVDENNCDTALNEDSKNIANNRVKEDPSCDATNHKILLNKVPTANSIIFSDNQIKDQLNDEQQINHNGIEQIHLQTQESSGQLQQMSIPNTNFQNINHQQSHSNFQQQQTPNVYSRNYSNLSNEDQTMNSTIQMMMNMQQQNQQQQMQMQQQNQQQQMQMMNMQQQNQQQQMQMMTMLMNQSKEESKQQQIQMMTMMTTMIGQVKEDSKLQSETMINLVQNMSKVSTSDNTLNNNLNKSGLSGCWEGITDRVRMELIRNPPPIWISETSLCNHLLSKTKSYINNNQMSWVEIKKVIKLTFKSQERCDCAIKIYEDKVDESASVTDTSLDELFKSISISICGSADAHHDRIKKFETFMDVLNRVAIDKKDQSSCEKYQNALKYMLNEDNKVLNTIDIKTISDLMKTFQDISIFNGENAWESEERIFRLLRSAQKQKDSKKDTTFYNNRNILNKPNPSYKNTFNSKTYVNPNGRFNNFNKSNINEGRNFNSTTRNTDYNRTNYKFNQDQVYQRKIKCYNCNQFGHFARSCPSSKVLDKTHIQNPTKPEKVLWLSERVMSNDTKSQYNESDDGKNLRVVRSRDNLETIKVHISNNQSDKFEDIDIEAVADTGCTSDGAISIEAMVNMGLLDYFNNKAKKIFENANTKDNSTAGEVKVKITHDGKTHDVTLDVVKDLTQEVILGNNFLSKTNWLASWQTSKNWRNPGL